MTIWNPDLTKFEGPRYKALANAIEADIQTGKIGPGFKLPTHRDLADKLGVTVGTITRGYAEAAQRGLLRGETGRGTYVAGVHNPRDEFLNHSEDIANEAVDMGMTLPLYNLDPNMTQTFLNLSQQDDLQGILHYYPSKGRLKDRETGAQWLRNHYIETQPEDVLITAGGQHSLAVILGAAFRPGDSIAVESFTYPLFKTLARRFRIKLISVEMDEQGMLPENLEQICKQQNIKGIYCMPTCHNPTTAHMTHSRRAEIASLAEKYELLIIEDDAYALLHPNPYKPLFNYLPQQTFYIASLSKAVTSGLRFGYLLSPSEYNRRLEQCIADTMWMASPVAARIAAHWINDGTALETIRNKKEESIQRNLLAQKILKDHSFRDQKTGYFIWLRLPDHWNATEFAQQANEQRVIVTPGQYFSYGRNDHDNNYVRVAISAPRTRADLTRGLEVIRQLLDEDYSGL